MQPKILALAAAGSLLAAAAYFIGARPAPPKSEQADAKLASELLALRREVQSLKQTQTRTALANQPSEHAAEANAAPPPAPAASDAPPVSQDDEQAAAETNRQIASELDARYTKEPADPAWSVANLRKIRDVAATLKGARLIDANCATSLCRVVLGHNELGEQSELGRQLVALDPFTHGVFYSYDNTPGALKTTLYVLREGKTFKDVRQSSL
jgi:type IV secretory pathway VirB10-like protein